MNTCRHEVTIKSLRNIDTAKNNMNRSRGWESSVESWWQLWCGERGKLGYDHNTAPAPDTIQTQAQDGLHLHLHPPPGHRGQQPRGPHRQRGHRQERQEGDCGGRSHHQPG